MENFGNKNLREISDMRYRLFYIRLSQYFPIKPKYYDIFYCYFLVYYLFGIGSVHVVPIKLS